MANTVKIKHSDVSTAAPATLEQGELAINTADALLFWEDDVGVINSTHLSPTPSDIGAATAASPTFTGVITVSAGTAAAPAIISGTGTSDTGVFWPAADTFAVSTAGSERLRVDSSGRVGIGSANPAFGKLEVGLNASQMPLDGHGDAVALRELGNAGNNSIGVTTVFANGAFNTPYQGRWRVQRKATAANFEHIFEVAYGTAASNVSEVLRTSNDEFVVSTGGAERLRVDSSGRVGIGTASIDSGVTLDTRGTIQAKAAGVKIQAVDSSVIVKTQASNATSEGIVGTESNHNLAIRSNNVAALRVKTSGAVRFVPLSADPASGEAGDVYYNSSTNKLRVYNGTSWIDLH